MIPKIHLKNNKLIVEGDYHTGTVCASVGSGFWNKKDRVWEFSLSVGAKLRHSLTDAQITPEAQQRIDEIVKKINIIRELKQHKNLEAVLLGSDADFLMEHQRLCVAISKLANSYAFYLDTGTGKTVTALEIINQNKDIKWVVVCPKTIIKTAWMEDHLMFYPDLKILPLSKNIKTEDYLEIARRWEIPLKGRNSVAELREKLTAHAQVFIINPESFKKETDFLQKQGVTGLIFDESVKIKDNNAQITKTTLKFGYGMKKIYILSGEPAPNNPLEYFPQMKLIDEGVFGSNFYSFRNKFFATTDYLGYNWKLKPNMEELFSERLSMKSLFIGKNECLDLPEKLYQTRGITLKGDAFKYYKQMEINRMLQVEESVTIAPNILTSIMKLRQITSGFVIDNDAETHMLHTQKLDELSNVLEEIGKKQVIIWCNFKNEIRTIENMLLAQGKKVVTAYSGTKDTDESVRLFKEGKVQYIIANPKTLKYGVTFVKCSYAVYYSLSYSYDDYYQSHDRIYRKGQEKPCTFIFLICENTIDEVIYDVLKQKGDISEAIKRYSRLLK